MPSVTLLQPTMIIAVAAKAADHESGDPQASRTQPTGHHGLQTLPGPIRDRGFIPVATPTGACGAGLEKDGEVVSAENICADHQSTYTA